MTCGAQRYEKELNFKIQDNWIAINNAKFGSKKKGNVERQCKNKYVVKQKGYIMGGQGLGLVWIVGGSCVFVHNYLCKKSVQTIVNSLFVYKIFHRYR